MLITKKVSYQDQDVTCIGHYACHEEGPEKKPTILVAHDWSGCNEFAQHKAEKLAEQGYVGFAIDMYGEGELGVTKEEKTELIQPLMHDRALLQRRITAAFEFAKTLPHVDSEKIAAIGFCFGGLCVLDLARSGVNVKGVVSFHGLLNAPENMPPKHIMAKILALHGYDDPMVTPDQVRHFADEMTKARADWQLTMYGNTMHAFTNPSANDHAFGTVYNKIADERSWLAMNLFFKEIF